MVGSTGMLVLLLCCLPSAVVCLTCYTCMFPSISPLDCLKFPQECPEGQRCLYSTAIGIRGSVTIVLHEKGCAVASQCGQSGEKHAAGLDFNFTNTCCDTDLCNAATLTSAPCWRGVALSLFTLFLIIVLC